MTNNELMTASASLAVYNMPDQNQLVEIRRDPTKYPRIKATPHNQAVSAMEVLVFKAFVYRGQEVSAQTISRMADVLVSEIMADRTYSLGDLSWEEIGMVFRNAVLGNGREMYGVTIASLYQAITDYVKGPGTEAAKKAKQLNAASPRYDDMRARYASQLLNNSTHNAQ